MPTRPTGEEIETPLTATSTMITTAWRMPTRNAGTSRTRTRRPGEACDHAEPPGTAVPVRKNISVPIQRARPRTTGTRAAATVAGLSAVAPTSTGVVTTVTRALRWSSV